MIMSFGAPIGAAIGAPTADRLERKPAIITASAAAILFDCIYPFAKAPMVLMCVGLALAIPIYVLVALLCDHHSRSGQGPHYTRYKTFTQRWPSGGASRRWGQHAHTLLNVVR